MAVAADSNRDFLIPERAVLGAPDNEGKAFDELRLFFFYRIITQKPADFKRVFEKLFLFGEYFLSVEFDKAVGISHLVAVL